MRDKPITPAQAPWTSGMMTSNDPVVPKTCDNSTNPFQTTWSFDKTTAKDPGVPKTCDNSTNPFPITWNFDKTTAKDLGVPTDLINPGSQPFQEKPDLLTDPLRQAPNELSRQTLRPLLLTMPSEILSIIARNAAVDKYGDRQQANISNLRLTCHQLADVGAMYLVPRVGVEMTSKSLSKLEAISQHPIISKSVRLVCLDLTFYSPALARDLRLFFHNAVNHLEEYVRNWNATQPVVDSWEEFVRTEQEPVSYPARGHVHALLHAFMVYRARTSEQQYLLRGGKLSGILAAAMAKMPMAQTLCIDCGDDSDAFTRSGEAFTEGGYLSAEYVEDLTLHKMSWHTTYDLGDKLDGQLYTNEAPTFLLYQLPIEIAKAAQGRIHVRHLDLANSGERWGHISELSVEPTHGVWGQDDRPFLEAFVQSLKSFVVHSRKVKTKVANGEFNWRKWFKVFASGSRLEVLDFKMIDKVRTPLDDILSHVRTSKLREIRLYYCKIRQDVFEQMLKRHQDKQVRVDLYNVELASGTWADVLDLIQQKGAVESQVEICYKSCGAECDSLTEEELDDMHAAINQYIRSSPKDLPRLPNPFRLVTEEEEATGKSGATSKEDATGSENQENGDE